MADISFYREEVKLKLTGGLLELELDDALLDKIIDSAFREIQRYIDTTKIETIPFSKCIDLSPRKVNAVVNIYRTKGIGGVNNGSLTDPAYMMQWSLFSPTGSTMYNYDNFVYNYSAWLTALLTRNTLSTDLAFRYDRETNKLYINTLDSNPTDITIEYIPRFDDISEIISDYWIDVLIKMSLALTKMILGRIRTRYTPSSAVWTQDGATLLLEGTDELKVLRESLKHDTQLMYPID